MIGINQRLVGAYDTYGRAERAVDHLADQRFPVEHTTIVGRGLHSVERVTGRLGYLAATVRYAVSGALLGALIGWLFGLFNVMDPLVSAARLALTGIIIGGVIAGVSGFMGHALTGGRRDFRSVQTVRADTYQLLVDADFAEEAARLLESGSTQAARPAPASNDGR